MVYLAGEPLKRGHTLESSVSGEAQKDCRDGSFSEISDRVYVLKLANRNVRTGITH